jgi:Mitochondrial protein Pet127
MRRIHIVGQVSTLRFKPPYICISCLTTICHPLGDIAERRIRYVSSTPAAQVKSGVEGTEAAPTNKVPRDIKPDFAASTATKLCKILLSPSQTISESEGAFSTSEDSCVAKNGTCIAPEIHSVEDGEQSANKNNQKSLSKPKLRKVKGRGRQSMPGLEKAIHLPMSKSASKGEPNASLSSKQTDREHDLAQTPPSTEESPIDHPPTNRRKVLKKSRKLSRKGALTAMKVTDGLPDSDTSRASNRRRTSKKPRKLSRKEALATKVTDGLIDPHDNSASDRLEPERESRKLSLKEALTTTEVTDGLLDPDTSSDPSKTPTLRRVSSNKQRKLSSLEENQDHPEGPPLLPPRDGVKTYKIETIKAEEIEFVPLDKLNPPPPSLSYGLERVLFNPGVYHLRDPRSRVYNFDPYLQSIMPVDEFDFSALKKYMTSSEDKVLASTAATQNKKYTGSTSSMTTALGHFHYLLSHWRPLNISKLSRGFPDKLLTFTNLLRAPAAIFLRWKDGTYAIDADKEFDSANILMMLGKSMEKLLTLPTAEFEKYRKANSDQLSEAELNEPESFHYTTIGDFLLRSQLDAHDPRLPGTGVFDLKTRAVFPIRMDAANYRDGTGYEIRSLYGRFESFEREYYDMMRSAFLKYSLQVRMGRMDGIFVAFHNVERIFGFQYISLPEMDEVIHGQSDLTLGNDEFKLSLQLLNRVLDHATRKFPQKSLRIFFETRESNTPFMYIFAEPVTDDDIEKIQESKKAEIEEWERKALGLDHDRPSESTRDEVTTGWENLQAKVEETVESDELGVSESNDDIHERNAYTNPDNFCESIMPEKTLDGWSEHAIGKDPETLETLQTINKSEDVAMLGVNNHLNLEAACEVDSGQEMPPGHGLTSMEAEDNIGCSREDSNAQESTSVPEGEPHPQQGTIGGKVKETSLNRTKSSTQSSPSAQKEILAMTLTIRNKVNNKYVPRPVDLIATDKWSIEYAISEVPGNGRAYNLYQKSQRRRARALEKTCLDDRFVKLLRNVSRKGRNWRLKQDMIDKKEPIKILGDLSTITNEAERSP